MVPGLARVAVAHVVGHELDVIDDLGDLVHFGVAHEIVAGADRDRDDAVRPERVAQRLQQGRVIFPVARVGVDAGHVVAGVLPVDVDAVQPVFLNIGEAGGGEGAAARVGQRHGGEAARAPAADREHDADRRVPAAELLDAADVGELVRVKQAVLDEAEGEVDVRELQNVVLRNVRQGRVRDVTDRIVFHKARFLSGFVVGFIIANGMPEVNVL